MGKYLTIREVNYETERLRNTLNKLLEDKEILETLVNPQSIDYEKVIVDGGKHASSIQEVYILKTELPRWQDLDKRIKQTQELIDHNEQWIERELKILKDYDKKLEQIVYYREQSKEKYTWQQISNRIFLSESQCRKIYRGYKNRRDLV